jgi:hypothetical protein
LTAGENERAVSSFLDSPELMLKLCESLARVEREWPSLAGEALARRSFPRAFEDGVLIVSVENRFALQDMNFKKSAVLKRIREETPLRLKDIKTEMGRPKKRV